MEHGGGLTLFVETTFAHNLTDAFLLIVLYYLKTTFAGDSMKVFIFLMIGTAASMFMSCGGTTIPIHTADDIQQLEEG